VHISKEPLLGVVILAASESGIQVFLPVVAVQQHPDPREDVLTILSQTIKVPEQTGIRGNPKPTFTQHVKTAKCSDGIRVQVD
jgi:hypothetical protein